MVYILPRYFVHFFVFNVVSLGLITAQQRLTTNIVRFAYNHPGHNFAEIIHLLK